MIKYSFLILLLFSFLFDKIQINEIYKQISPLEKDTNGFYHYKYSKEIKANSNDYGTIKYFTEKPTTRVFWNSPDSFWVVYQGKKIGEPIVKYSTYSNNKGYGQQLFYVYPSFIGDTLSVYGYISLPSTIDSAFIIID